MIRELPLRRGGTAGILDCNAERAQLETDFPSPPGSTVELLLLGAPLGVKVKSCRKAEKGGRIVFHIEGRWVGLSREQRVALLEAEPNAGAEAGSASLPDPG